MSIATSARIALGVLALAVVVRPAEARQQAPAVAAVTLQEARTAVDAAEAEARRNGWKLVFVITDAEGTPLYLRRMDGVPKRNYDVVMSKVGTSIKSGMHTADYAAAVQAGTIEPIQGAVTSAGGMLLRRNGQVVGAFGASGAKGAQDAQAVLAGMAAIGIAAGPGVAGASDAAAPGESPVTDAAPVRVPKSVLERYVGEYAYDQGFTVTVRLKGDTLTGQPGGQQEVVLVPISETRFKVGGGPTEVEFVIDQAGGVTKVIRQGGQESRARKKS